MTDPLVTYAEAAAMCGVPEATVRQWKSRGHLTPAKTTPRACFGGKQLWFYASDVLRADNEARNYPGGRKRKDAA